MFNNNRLYFLRVLLTRKYYIIGSLRRIFGIGLTRSKKIFSVLGLNPKLKSKKKKFFRYINLNINQLKLNLLAKSIEKSYIIDYELKSCYRTNVRNLKNIKCYRGIRHTMMLPTRGQRTHTNGSTLKKILLSKFKKFK